MTNYHHDHPDPNFRFPFFICTFFICFKTEAMFFPFLFKNYSMKTDLIFLKTNSLFSCYACL